MQAERQTDKQTDILITIYFAPFLEVKQKFWKSVRTWWRYVEEEHSGTANREATNGKRVSVVNADTSDGQQTEQAT